MKTFLLLVLTFMLPTVYMQNNGKATLSLTDTETEYVYTANSHTYRIWIERITDSLYVLHHETEGKELSSWELPYPVYRFCCGNLTGDRTPEIAVGVIKPTRYFKDSAKRLFLFKLYHGKLIRPLWLGSRVGYPLEDFRIEPPTPEDSLNSDLLHIHTIERKHDGTLVEAIYRYGGFGLKFKHYL